MWFLFSGPRDFTSSCLTLLISVGCTYFREQYSSYGSTCRDPRGLRASSQWSYVRPRQQHAWSCSQYGRAFILQL
uniref:Uncharacterized protein n=1 Tax=Triticum urartu TaxID=4572 RepID=A0A8R7V590_TRIUA